MFLQVATWNRNPTPTITRERGIAVNPFSINHYIFYATNSTDLVGNIEMILLEIELTP